MSEPAGIATLGGAVLRAPALPLNALDGVLAAPDEDRVDRALSELLAQPVVAEAIALASPNLHRQIGRWRAGDAGPDHTRLRASYLAYVVRMATRCTPFGGFAGCAMVKADETAPATTLALGHPSEARTHTRLDVELLARLVRSAAADRDRRDGLTFVANPSVYSAGGKLRLAEASYNADGLRYRRVAVNADEEVLEALTAAAVPGTPAELTTRLVKELDDETLAIDDVRSYIEDLIDAQLLVPTAEPAVTGAEPGPAVAAALSANPATASLGRALGGSIEALAAFDAAPPGRDVAPLAAELRALEEAGAEPNPSTLFQADLVLSPAHGTALGVDVLDRVRAGIDVLHRVFPPPSPDADLARFATAFEQRYEGAWVPLLEALDEEVGVGFARVRSADGQPLVPWPLATPAAPTSLQAQDPVLVELANAALVAAAREGGVPVVRLRKEDMERLSEAAGGGSSRRPLPASFAATCLLDGPPSDPASRLILQAAHGPSGARVLGRFAHADDGIAALVRDVVTSEEAADPDHAYAELVHLPEGRLGNVLCRPVLRGHELVFLGRSGLGDVPEALPLDDLLVTVRGGVIDLWSRRLERPIRPRMATAHNWMLSRLAPYRFLCALQGQGVADALTWRWGVASMFPTFPRVETADGVVLSRASWRLTAAEVAALCGDDARAAQTVRVDRGLPGRVAIAEADNELAIDLGTLVGRLLMRRQADRGGGTVTVVEAARAGLAGPDGWRTCELVVPFASGVQPGEHARSAVATPRVEVPSSSGDTSFTRRFGPGSEWLSIRLGCGQGTADSLLRDLVSPWLTHACQQGVVDGWFFLRYADPDHHLRVRLHGSSPAGLLSSLDALVAPLLDDGRVTTCQVDTYRREVDRYGGSTGVELFEAISSADSDAVLSIVGGGGGLDERWQLTVLGVHRLVNAFVDPDAPRAIRIATARQWLGAWREGLRIEHGPVGPQLLARAGTVNRTDGRLLAALAMGSALSGVSRSLASGVAALDRRDQALATAVVDVRALSVSGELSVPLADYAGSVCHMHCNRMLRAAQRAQELIVYDLVDRLLRGEAARLR